MKKVFLAGVIDANIKDAWIWRHIASEELIKAGFRVLNPLEGIINITTWTKYDFVTDDYIFCRDLQLLGEADFMLVNQAGLETHPSSTLVELGIAYRDHTPIFSFGSSAHHKLPLFARLLGIRYHTLSDAVEALETYNV